MKNRNVNLTLHFCFICVLLFSTALFLFVRCADERLLTPLEKTSAEELTTYDEMIVFLNGLQENTQNFTIDTIAVSVEGREILLLHFTDSQPPKTPNTRSIGAPSGQAGQAGTPGVSARGGPASGRQEKITVLLYAQQHGDEPSGKEALIQLSRDIATGEFTGFLRTIDLFVVPQVNPDGAEKQQRFNAREVDLNRNHLTLTEPEVLGLHEVFQTYLPEVTLDIHEYDTQPEAWAAAGYKKNFGIQLGAVSNTNISMPIRSFAWNTVFPSIESDLRMKNIRFQRYLVADDPAKRFRYSTTAINDGRNSMGIYNTLSFIQEGPRDESINSAIHERTRQQLEAVKSFLTFFAQRSSYVKRIVHEEREKMIAGSDRPRVYLTMDYAKDPAEPSVTVPVILLENDQETGKTFDNYYPLVHSTVSVVRPQGYAVPPDQVAVLDVLRKHKIEIQVSDKAARGILELYTMNSVAQTEIEDKEMLTVKVTVSSSIAKIPEGYSIVWCNQLQSLQLIIMLEPHSLWGLAQQPGFPSLLQTGTTYPIIRIMRIIEN